MTCDEAHQQLDPFFDNELGLAEAQKVQQHLEQCPACEEAYAARLAVRQALQKPEVRFFTPDDLRGQIRVQLSKQVSRTRRPTWRVPAFQLPNWLLPSLAGAAAALAVWFGSNVFFSEN